MTQHRIIKKYSNRKLYDTHKHNYVTLQDLANIFRDSPNTKIVDVRTNQDITQKTLLTAIAAKPSSSHPETQEVLTQLLTTHDGCIASYLNSKLGKV